MLVASKSLVLYDPVRVDPELCWFGETGIGWFGRHHCFYCFVYAYWTGSDTTFARIVGKVA